MFCVFSFSLPSLFFFSFLLPQEAPPPPPFPVSPCVCVCVCFLFFFFVFLCAHAKRPSHNVHRTACCIFLSLSRLSPPPRWLRAFPPPRSLCFCLFVFFFVLRFAILQCLTSSFTLSFFFLFVFFWMCFFFLDVLWVFFFFFAPTRRGARVCLLFAISFLIVFWFFCLCYSFSFFFFSIFVCAVCFFVCLCLFFFLLFSEHPPIYVETPYGAS